MASTACGFSILAMTGTRMPTSSITLCTSSMSPALRTKESAIMSTPSSRANRRSSLSFSDRAGTLTAAPGRLIPLLFESTPPSTTTVFTRGPSTLTTSRAMTPSLIRIGSPGFTSPGRPL